MKRMTFVSLLVALGVLLMQSGALALQVEPRRLLTTLTHQAASAVVFALSLSSSVYTGQQFPLDLNLNGRIDAIIIQDGVILDLDENGVFERGFLDRNANAFYDTVWIDENGDGLMPERRVGREFRRLNPRQEAALPVLLRVWAASREINPAPGFTDYQCDNGTAFVTYLRKVDAGGDGFAEIILYNWDYDSNADGTPNFDSGWVDSDRDGMYDYVWSDKNNDGQVQREELIRVEEVA